MADVMLETGDTRFEQRRDSDEFRPAPLGYMPSAPHAGGILFDPSLVPSQFQFDSLVVDRRDYKEPLEVRQGHLTFESYLMSDNFHHHVMTGIPRYQRTGIPIDMGTAWWTHLEGHNMHTALRFMEMGFPVRLVGSERINLPRIITPWNFMEIARQLAKIELARSAHNKLQILHINDLANPYTITPNVSLSYGESRDAMIHPGEQFLATTAIEEAQRRQYVYSEDVDPACSDPLEIAPPTPEQIERLIAELRAAKHVGWRIFRSPLRKHYKHTLDFSLNSLFPQFATAPTLFSGQAGELARLAPDTPRSINAFVMSAGLTGDGFESKYEGKENTHFFNLDGAHLNIPDILEFVVPSLTVIRDHLVKHSDDPRGIDFEQVWAAKTEAINAAREKAQAA